MVIFHSYVSLPEGITNFVGSWRSKLTHLRHNQILGFRWKNDEMRREDSSCCALLNSQLKKKARWKMDTSEKCCIYNVDGCNIRISTSFGRQLKQSIFFRPWNSCDHKWSHFFYVSLLRPRKSPSKWPGWGRFFGSQIILEQGNPWQS